MFTIVYMLVGVFGMCVFYVLGRVGCGGEGEIGSFFGGSEVILGLERF